MIVAFLLGGLAFVPAQELVHSARFTAGSRYLTIDLAAHGDVGSQVLSSVESGMRSELVFSIRVYVPRHGLAAIIGDQLVLELAPSHTGWFDLFRQRFVVTNADGLEYTFADPGEFLAFFMTIPEYRLPWSLLPEEPPVLLEIAATLRPVKLVPALAVLGLLTRDGRIDSPRRRYHLSSIPGTPQ